MEFPPDQQHTQFGYVVFKSTPAILKKIFPSFIVFAFMKAVSICKICYVSNANLVFKIQVNSVTMYFL